MYLILNRDEVVVGLAKRILAHHLCDITLTWTAATAYLNKMQKRHDKTGLIEIDFAALNQLLMQDTANYKDHLTTVYKQKYRKLISWLCDNYEKIGVKDSQLIRLYLDDPSLGFVKTMGQQITDDPVWKVAGDHILDDLSMLIRGNSDIHHSVLCHRIKNKLPFWFIDTGYTNFLTGKKTWHRLVPNHLHHVPHTGYFPADRLHLFSNMPRHWKTTGKTILVIENSERHYRMFGTSLKEWKENIQSTLGKLTDKPVIFRPKSPNIKDRDSLYDHLLASDYYCVISDASAAAIESVWAGIPIITLNTHISIPVARTRLEDINDLYRGPIGDWLCSLSYSQFTQKEMFNGTAWKIMSQYHV